MSSSEKKLNITVLDIAVVLAIANLIAPIEFMFMNNFCFVLEVTDRIQFILD